MWNSKVKDAVALVEAGATIAQAAATVGVTYQTVYVYTKGKVSRKRLETKYAVCRMAKTGKKSAGQIANKAGITTSKVVAILKQAGVKIEKKKTVVKQSTPTPEMQLETVNELVL